MITCKAAKDKDVPILFGGAFCNESAVYRDRLNTPLCEKCARERKRAHELGQTVLSMLVGKAHGSPGTYPLYPIQ